MAMMAPTNQTEPAKEEPTEVLASDASTITTTTTTTTTTNVAPTANVVLDDDDDELEEGELKDDDDADSDDDDDYDETNKSMSAPQRLLPINSSGGVCGEISQAPTTASATSVQGLDDGVEHTQKKKRKKRVIRKVKKKIMVRKKVAKKKMENQLSPNPPTSTQPPPSIQSAPNQAAPNSLDSLWEQQVLMLQELQRQQQQQQQNQPQQPQQLPQAQNQSQPQPQSQAPPSQQLQQQPQQQPQSAQQPPPHFNPYDYQHADILRAAATDEDLRYLQPVSILYNTAPVPVSQAPTAQATQPLPQPQPQLQQPQPKPQPNPLQQNTQQLNTQQNAPSSPDNEDNKPSYEAITKMLTLLKSSADNNESPQSVQYSLVPVIVEGIDYTKYKLLSKYEPKLKKDPRLVE